MLRAQGLENGFWPFARSTAREGEDYLCGAVCRVWVWAIRSALRRAQAGFHPGQPFQHAVARGAVGKDFPQSSNNILCREVVLNQLRHDFLAGDQVDHGEAWDLDSGLAQQVS